MRCKPRKRIAWLFVSRPWKTRSCDSTYHGYFQEANWNGVQICLDFPSTHLGVGLEQNAGASFGPNVPKQYISTYIQSLDSILSGHCITSKHEFSWMKFIKGHRGSECICWFFCRVFELLTMLVCVYFLILGRILSAP